MITDTKINKKGETINLLNEAFRVYMNVCKHLEKVLFRQAFKINVVSSNGIRKNVLVYERKLTK